MSVEIVKAFVDEQEYVLKWDPKTSRYKAVITAPSKTSYQQPNHYYDVRLKATSHTGNVIEVDSQSPTLGEHLRLRTLEKKPPIIVPEYPKESSLIGTASPLMVWTISDDESGVDPNTISISIDEAPPIAIDINKIETHNGYRCEYKPVTLSDGPHVYKLNAADFDGNSAIEISINFRVDATPPILIVKSPNEDLITNTDHIMIKGITYDIASRPVVLTVNGTPIEIDSQGRFSYEYALSIGRNPIEIVATDAVGQRSIVMRNVILDMSPPQIQDIRIEPNPVDAGATFMVVVSVMDAQ